jgi:hypothetical protein
MGYCDRENIREYIVEAELLVDRIQRIVGQEVIQQAETDKDGRYHCFPEGQTKSKFAQYFSTLDEVAEYLLENERSQVRMNPNWSRIIDNIHIDGVPREEL